MRYLSLALYAEGPTDQSFLRPILQRTCEQLCLLHSRVRVEVADVLTLLPPSPAKGGDRATRILRAAREAQGAWDVLVVHADGAGDPGRARKEQVEPGLAAVRSALGEASGRGIAVIPIRETEAWALVDGSALRQAFGTRFTDSRLGVLTNPRDVEAVFDPKRSLDEVFTATRVNRRRRGRGPVASDFLDSIGTMVSLDILAKVPGFMAFRQDLEVALRSLSILDQ